MILSNVAFSYGGVAIFDGLTLQSDANLVVLRGPSGCGKTTLLKLIVGMLKPVRGEIRDVPVRIPLVLQADALLPWLSAADNIAAVVGIKAEAVRSDPRFSDIGYLDSAAWQLSFGQRRFVEVLRVLNANAGMVCIDEPFNYLDPQRRQKIIELFSNFMRSGRRLVISNHHDDDLSDLHPDVYSFDGKLPAFCNKLA